MTYRFRFISAVVLAAAAVSAAQAQATDTNDTREQVKSSLRVACSADFERLCNGVQPGGGRIAMCLKTHQSALSAECLTAVSQARQMKAEQSGSQQR